MALGLVHIIDQDKKKHRTVPVNLNILVLGEIQELQILYLFLSPSVRQY